MPTSYGIKAKKKHKTNFKLSTTEHSKKMPSKIQPAWVTEQWLRTLTEHFGKGKTWVDIYDHIHKLLRLICSNLSISVVVCYKISEMPISIFKLLDQSYILHLIYQINNLLFFNLLLIFMNIFINLPITTH